MCIHFIRKHDANFDKYNNRNTLKEKKKKKRTSRYIHVFFFECFVSFIFVFVFLENILIPPTVKIEH